MTAAKAGPERKTTRKGKFAKLSCKTPVATATAAANKILQEGQSVRKLVAALIISGLIMGSIIGTAMANHYIGIDQFCRNGEGVQHAHGSTPTWLRHSPTAKASRIIESWSGFRHSEPGPLNHTAGLSQLPESLTKAAITREEGSQLDIEQRAAESPALYREKNPPLVVSPARGPDVGHGHRKRRPSECRQGSVATKGLRRRRRTAAVLIIRIGYKATRRVPGRWTPEEES